MSNDPQKPNSHQADAHDEHEHHVLPLSVYYGVFASLLVLTYLTVQVSIWDLGAIALPVAMFVALIKASLVVAYFMHLRYDDKFLTLLFGVSILFLGVFFGFTMIDLTSRNTWNPEEATAVVKMDDRKAPPNPNPHHGHGHASGHKKSKKHKKDHTKKKAHSKKSTQHTQKRPTKN